MSNFDDILTLDEVMKIREDGKTQRQNTEQELRKLESDVKQKLLEMR